MSAAGFEATSADDFIGRGFGSFEKRPKYLSLVGNDLRLAKEAERPWSEMIRRLNLAGVGAGDEAPLFVKSQIICEYGLLRAN